MSENNPSFNGWSDPTYELIRRTAETMGATPGPDEVLEPTEIVVPNAGERIPYYVLTPDGQVRFCDIVTGETLEPNEIPRSVLEDETLRKGIDFWDRYGHRITVRQVAGQGDLWKNGTALKESGVDLAAEVKQLGGDRCTVFVSCPAPYGKERREAIGSSLRNISQFSRRDLRKPEIRQSIERFIASIEKGSPGLAAIARQLEGSGADVKLVSGCDWTQWTKGDEAITHKGREGRQGEPEYDPRHAASVESYADWQTIARIGNSLNEQLRDTGMRRRGVLYVGDSHEHVSDKLRGFDVRASSNMDPAQ